MAAVPENRWRAGGPNAAQNRSAAKGGASTSTSNNNTPQQRSRQLSASASTIPAEPVVPSLPTGNVWTNHARPPTTSVAKHSNPTAFISDTSNGAVIVKQQTSNISFNTDEVKEYFEQALKEIFANDTKKVGLYKSATNDVAAVKGTVWGAKPSTMASGQDFWVQLSKQVAAREQGGGG